MCPLQYTEINPLRLYSMHVNTLKLSLTYSSLPSAVFSTSHELHFFSTSITPLYKLFHYVLTHYNRFAVTVISHMLSLVAVFISSLPVLSNLHVYIYIKLIYPQYNLNVSLMASIIAKSTKTTGNDNGEKKEKNQKT